MCISIFRGFSFSYALITTWCVSTWNEIRWRNCEWKKAEQYRKHICSIRQQSTERGKNSKNIINQMSMNKFSISVSPTTLIQPTVFFFVYVNWISMFINIVKSCQVDEQQFTRNNLKNHSKYDFSLPLCVCCSDNNHKKIVFEKKRAEAERKFSIQTSSHVSPLPAWWTTHSLHEESSTRNELNLP